MTYSPLLIFHIAGGVVAIISGFVALFVRKGSRLHRRSGVVFAISMFVMAAGGGYVALVKSQPSNVLAALFTFYLITTAWLTVKRKQKAPDKVDAALTLMAIATGIGALVLGARAHKGAVM